MGRRGQNDASANNRGHSRPLRAASYGRGCGYSGRSVTMDCSADEKGPVAQLGARLNGIQEVTGSIPVRSITLHPRQLRDFRRRATRFCTVDHPVSDAEVDHGLDVFVQELRSEPGRR